ncbi:MAG: hypothetical protein ABI758_05455 [Candidatus Woesebacteria bacterium]
MSGHEEVSKNHQDPNLTKRVHEMSLRRQEQFAQRLAAAQVLEQKLDSVIIGIWGHLTGNGAREYFVFQENDSKNYFIIQRWNEEGVLDGREERWYINPESTPNRVPVRSIEKYTENL